MGDYRTTAGEQAPVTMATEIRAKHRFWLTAILIILVVVLLGFAIRIPRFTSARGYVTSMNYAEVRPPVTGIVSRILVSSGQTVKKGQVLVELKTEEEEAMLAETRARLTKLHTEMERRTAEMDIDLDRRRVVLEEQKRQNADDIFLAQLVLDNANVRLDVTRQLVKKGLKAAIHLEEDTLTQKQAQLKLETLRKKDFSIYEELLKRDREKYDRELAALRNELTAMQDSVRRVEARIETRKIRAPIDGLAVRYEFVPGELLQPTHVIYEIFSQDRQVLKLQVSEKHAAHMRAGLRYRALLTSYRGLDRRYFHGKVEALRDVIQTRGESSYRVVYCSFDSQGLDIPPGTTAEARVYYGESCFWFFLFNL